jgi:hypothetical protein
MDDFVAAIFDELETCGLNDPRPLAQRGTLPLEDYLRSEVRRSIERVQTLTNPPADLRNLFDSLPPRPMSYYRRIAKELEAVAFLPSQIDALRQLQAIEQEPPERGDALKYRCAAEAYYLMDLFSSKPPTGTFEGPFQTIAGVLYNAVTGCEPTDMKRSCDRVLERRRYAEVVSNRPC